MKYAIGIIPARYHSSRFDGKPLALISGKPMIQRVYEGAQTAKLLERIIIATDDERILKVAEGFGAEAQMTSPLHQTGTDRIAEIAKEIEASIIINIQGDEPLIKGEMIDDLVVALQDNSIPMATLAVKLDDVNLVFRTAVGFALNFTRIPDNLFQHIGIYGYQKEFLLKFSKLRPSMLEKTEGLEQLRALENGYNIKVIETHWKTQGVNFPSDIKKVENILKEEAS